jgi:hypothetical protein
MGPTVPRAMYQYTDNGWHQFSSHKSQLPTRRCLSVKLVLYATGKSFMSAAFTTKANVTAGIFHPVYQIRRVALHVWGSSEAVLSYGI